MEELQQEIVKPKRTRQPRRPVTWPPFYRTPNKDIITRQFTSNLSIGNTAGPLRASPYMKYVPLYYLYSYNIDGIGYDEEYFRRLLIQGNPVGTGRIIPELSKFPEPLNELMYSRMVNNNNFRLDTGNQHNIRQGIRRLMFLDVTPMGISGNRYCSNNLDIIRAFQSNEQWRFHARGYNGYTGMFSIQVGEMPLITTVILGRDYIYHRANAILGIPLDLSKAIVFVDKRLDTRDEDEIPKSLKTLYRTKLEPILKSTAASIFKVPIEYVIERCFIPDKLKIKAKKIAEREKEIEEFLTSFYLNRPNGNPPIQAPSAPSAFSADSFVRYANVPSDAHTVLRNSNGDALGNIVYPVGSLALNGLTASNIQYVMPADAQYAIGVDPYHGTPSFEQPLAEITNPHDELETEEEVSEEAGEDDWEVTEEESDYEAREAREEQEAVNRELYPQGEDIAF